MSLRPEDVGRRSIAEHDLAGCRILVAEDEYLIADDIREALTDAGVEVLGPVATVEEAASLIAADPRIDAALLDINLRGTQIFAVADTLLERGVPFVFVTGYDRWAIPERFNDTPRLEKPIKVRQIAALLAPLVAAGAP